MSRRIATGIDIGTYQVKVVVVEEVADKSGIRQLHIIGTGLAESKGLRHGYIVNKEEGLGEHPESETTSGINRPRPRYVPHFSLSAASPLDEARATGSTVISRADQEITALDLDKVAKTAREAAAPGFLNRHVLHSIPLEYRIDGTKVLGDPLGMKGVRLEVDYLLSPASLNMRTRLQKRSRTPTSR